MTKRRVVVTGLGVISPIGNDVPTAWGNAVAGKVAQTESMLSMPNNTACRSARRSKTSNQHNISIAKKRDA